MGGELLEGTLENDRGYTGSLYSSDDDRTIRFFLSIGPAPQYRVLLLSVTDTVVAVAPERFKRFIRGGSSSHTAIGGMLYYTLNVNGLALYQWIADMVNGAPQWVDNVGAP